MDGFEIKSVGEDEGDVGVTASISEPIPAEHALAADGEAVAIGFHAFKEEGKVVVFDVGVDELLAFAVHDADVHLTRMEIDSAIELSGGRVIFHTIRLNEVSW